MKKYLLVAVAVASLGLVGCSGQPLAQTYMLPASLVGAGAGAIIDDNNRAEGALIGAVLGAGVGGFADTYLNTSGGQQQAQPQQVQPQQSQCWLERRGNNVVQICPQGQVPTAYAPTPNPQQGNRQQCRNVQEFTGKYDSRREPIYQVVRKCYAIQPTEGGYAPIQGSSYQGGGNPRYYQP